MRFDAVELNPVVGAPGRAGNARATWSERRSLRVRLRAQSGAWGEGEAAPLEGFSRETPDDVWAEAERFDPGRLDAEGHPWGWSIPVDSPALRFALESAMLDVRARSEARSTIALLGGDPRRRIPVNGLVDRLGAEGERLAGSWLRRGVRTLKIKVGRPDRDADELDLVEAIWRRTDARLRLDANGRLGPRVAEWAQRRVASPGPAGRRSARLEYIEDPGPIAPAGVPLALDEALLADPDAIERPGVAAIILKPTYWGGYGPMARVAARARSAGVGVVVTHALEVGAGFDAAVALGITLGTAGLAQGLAPHPFLLPRPRPHRLMQGWLRWRDVSR
jgi:O-succinylbenzoate synthase